MSWQQSRVPSPPTLGCPVASTSICATSRVIIIYFPACTALFLSIAEASGVLHILRSNFFAFQGKSFSTMSTSRTSRLLRSVSASSSKGSCSRLPKRCGYATQANDIEGMLSQKTKWYVAISYKSEVHALTLVVEGRRFQMQYANWLFLRSTHELTTIRYRF